MDAKKFLLHVTLTVAFIANIVSSEEVCHNKSDVVFIFELPQKNEVEALRKIKLIIQALNFQYTNGDCIQLAFDIVSGKVDEVQNLDCHGTCRRLLTQMKIDDVFNKLKRIGGSQRSLYKRNVVTAANSLNNRVFISRQGGREDARKIAVFVLTSAGNDAVSISDGVKFLHDLGIAIIAVGVGDGKEEDLYRITLALNRIVTSANMSVLALKSEKPYKVLTELVKAPDSYAFPLVLGYSATKTVLEEFDFVSHSPSEKCEYAADIGFLVDSSGSLKLDFDLELQFVQRIAASFEITEAETHAGVITFSDDAIHTKVQIPLNKYYSTKRFVNAVGELEHIGELTRIDLAFEKAEQELFNVRNGARPGLKKVIFLITDGNQYPKIDRGTGKKLDPVASSQNLYDNGVDIFVIGVGSGVNKDELKKIARDESKVYFAANFIELTSEEFVKNVSQKLCTPGELDVSTTSVQVTSTKSTSTTKTLTKAATSASTPKKTASKATSKPEITAERTTSKATSKSEVTAERTTSKATSKPEVTAEKATAKPAQSPTTRSKVETTCAPKSPCKGVGICSDCCTGKDIYINIFQPGTASQYIMQGLKIGQSGNSGSLSAIHIQPPQPQIDLSGKDKGLNDKEILDIIKAKLPNNLDVLKTLRTMLAAQSSGRKRRSVKTEDSTDLNALMSVAKAAGCSMFLEELKTYQDIMQKVIQIMKSNADDVTLFCPVDAAYNTYLLKNKVERFGEDLVRQHIGMKLDKQSLMYNTFSTDSKIQMTSNHRNKPTWKVHNANVLLMIKNQHGAVVVIDQVLLLPNLSLMDILSTNSNLSIMHKFWRKTNLNDILSKRHIYKVCFTENFCVRLKQTMRNHMKALLKFNQFTFQIPTNEYFSKMPPTMLESLIANSKIRKEFLSKHVFLGLLDPSVLSKNTKIMGIPISDKSPVKEMVLHKNTTVMPHSNGEVFIVGESIPIKEGLLQIIH